MSRLRVLALLGVAALAVAAVALATAGGDDAACEDPVAGVRESLCPIPQAERQPAPAQGLDLVDEGERGSIADYEGQVVVLNFWASWCGPCRAEQPDLNDAHGAVPAEQVAFLGVNIEDSRPNARGHQREFDIPYPSLFDPRNEYAAEFDGVGPRTIPTTLFLDRQGRVAARMFGSPRDATEVVALAEHLAGEGATESAAPDTGEA